MWLASSIRKTTTSKSLLHLPDSSLNLLLCQYHHNFHSLFQVRCIQNMSRYLGMRRQRTPPYESRHCGRLPKFKSKFPYFGKPAAPAPPTAIYRYSTPAKYISNAHIVIQYSFTTARLAALLRRHLCHALSGASIEMMGSIEGPNLMFLKIVRINDGAMLFKSEDYSNG